MRRIHPTERKLKRRFLEEGEVEEKSEPQPPPQPPPVVLTVWKKSTMSFQGTDGFSVFDGHGQLSFRLDNYSRASRCTAGSLVLMDGSGKPLLAIKPKMMSVHSEWNIVSEEGEGARPIFTMRRRRMVQCRDEAVVFKCGSGGREAGRDVPDFKIDGCFRKRRCKIWGGNGEMVAEISRKRASKSTVLLTNDVFNLVIKPGNDCKLIMAFVVIMDRIARKTFNAAFCS